MDWIKNIDKRTGYLTILVLWVIQIVLIWGIWGNRIDGQKKCCVKTAQEVYEYEGWVVSDCDEIN
tara:strand:+ start:414 stop:608 length:195 start_codon:yes stop_codon:yes gene_type:complete